MKERTELSRMEQMKIHGGNGEDDPINDPNSPPADPPEDPNKAFQLPGRGDNR